MKIPWKGLKKTHSMLKVSKIDKLISSLCGEANWTVVCTLTTDCPGQPDVGYLAS